MARAAAPRLVAITDLTRVPAAELLARAAQLSQLAKPGSLAVLLRDHQASPRERLELGRALSRIVHAAGQELWVADRLDLALLLEANGLHLGEVSVTARDARQVLGAERRVSRAWHDTEPLAEGSLLELEGVDSVLVSPILEARKGRPALGVAALGAFARSLQGHGQATEVLALGGVSAATAPSCLAAGAAGVAAIGAAWSSDSAELVQALGIAR
jgi:thiamine-phosphate pyrophosphorylase